jgi:hypothetical protein
MSMARTSAHYIGPFSTNSLISMTKIPYALDVGWIRKSIFISLNTKLKFIMRNFVTIISQNFADNIFMVVFFVVVRFGLKRDPDPVPKLDL